MQSEEDTPDQVASIPPASSTSQQNPILNPKIVYVWSWKETPSQMFQHANHSIVGDPSDCWIRYGRFSNNKLEAAHQTQTQSWDLDEHYVVDFGTMTQMNKRTGFQRQVQRTVDTPKVWCWKETEGLMWRHNPSIIYGNPSDCWIQYCETQNELLETAYMNGEDEVSPTNGFVVDFAEMVQTDEAIGFEREVQRFDASPDEDNQQPQQQKMQQMQMQIVPDTAAISSSATAATAVAVAQTAPKKVWCWQETDGFMGRHDPSSVYGDPSNSCWIRYDEEAAAILEDGFQTQPYGIVSPCEGYNVNLAIMKQVNIVTGFERDVQRVDEITMKQEEEADGDTFTVTEAQQMETRLQSELQNNADTTDQKLNAMSAKFKERQTAMEQDLETVRSQLQDTQSELKQTTVERDELKQEMASMKESLDGLKKYVEESVTATNRSPATATAVDTDSGAIEEKKRPNTDLEEENIPDQKRRRQENEAK